MNYSFTDGVRKALALAREASVRLGQDYVGTEHVLLGLIEENGTAAIVLEKLGLDPLRLRFETESRIRKGKQRLKLEELPYTSRAKKILEFAMGIARDHSHSYVGTEHLLGGVVYEEKGIGADVLRTFNVDRAAMDAVLVALWEELAVVEPSEAPEDANPDAHAERDLPLMPEVRVESDTWAEEDELGYGVYAAAIAQFLTEPRTEAPLAVGVLAPWGQGKTTLMRMISSEVSVLQKRAGMAALKDRGRTRRIATRLRDLRAWLNEPQSASYTKLRHPVVWFNPWKFQRREEVWAGLAHSVITQLVEQLPHPAERERFWLSLNARRLDPEAVRREIHRVVVERALPGILRLSAIGIVLLLAAAVLSLGTANARLVALAPILGATSLVPILGAIARGLFDRTQVLKSPLPGTFEKFVRMPEYGSGRGAYVQIEEDVEEVFDLLVEEHFPAVIFIDDLDRCSPKQTAELVEALNHFLAGDFKHCFFVIGMDPDLVANSIEVAYKEVLARLSQVRGKSSHEGWRFLEKFLQLQVVLPTLGAEASRDYLGRRFIRTAPLEEPGGGIPAQPVPISDMGAKNGGDTAGVVDARTRKALAVKAADLSRENEIIGGLVREYAGYLRRSPRSLKRYANLVRFYLLLQYGRELREEFSVAPELVGAAVLIMLRWPHVVRWVQWGHANLDQGAYERAAALQDQAQVARSQVEWASVMKDVGIPDPEALSEDLFVLLRQLHERDVRLSDAANAGIW